MAAEAGTVEAVLAEVVLAEAAAVAAVGLVDLEAEVLVVAGPADRGEKYRE